MFNGISASELILHGLLALAGIAVLISFVNLHRSNGKGNPAYRNFNLVHLIVNKDGFLDGAKCLEMGTFALMSWAFVFFVTTKSLPPWFLEAYLGVFVLRGAYGAYLRSKSPPEQTGVTMTTEMHRKEVTRDDS